MDRLLTALRIVELADSAYLDALLAMKESYAKNQSFPPINSRNEKIVITRLIEMCEEAYAEYPRSLEVDREIL